MSNGMIGSFQREVPIGDEGSCTTAWKLDDAPPDVVLVDISRFDFKLAQTPPVESQLPPALQLSVDGSAECRCTLQFADFWVDAMGYNLRVWFGHQVSDDDRELLDRTIASIQRSD